MTDIEAKLCLDIRRYTEQWTDWLKDKLCTLTGASSASVRVLYNGSLWHVTGYVNYEAYLTIKAAKLSDACKILYDSYAAQYRASTLAIEHVPATSDDEPF